MNTGLISRRREMLIMVGAFMVAALFFISMSVWATTIGTNISATGTVGVATTTPWGDLAVDQVASATALHPIFIVGDTGSSTPFLFVSQKGKVRVGTTSASSQDELIVDSLTSTATSTIHLGNGGSTSYGSCLQMYSSNGRSYKIYVSNGNASTTRLAIERGACE